jgi:hypothetical protein
MTLKELLNHVAHLLVQRLAVRHHKDERETVFACVLQRAERMSERGERWAGDYIAIVETPAGFAWLTHDHAAELEAAAVRDAPPGTTRLLLAMRMQSGRLAVLLDSADMMTPGDICSGAGFLS